MNASSTWITIAGLAAFAGALRLSGPFLERWAPKQGYWRRLIDELPSHLLVAMLMPVFLHPDWRLRVAALAAFAVRYLSGNVFVALLVAMALIAGLRAWT